MKDAREALEYLERVVEDRADIDPGIHVAIGVLSEAVDRKRELERLFQAVQGGNKGNRIRAAHLRAWADHFEREQGYNSTITHWLCGVAEALGKIEQVNEALRLRGEMEGGKSGDS